MKPRVEFNQLFIETKKKEGLDMSEDNKTLKIPQILFMWKNHGMAR